MSLSQSPRARVFPFNLDDGAVIEFQKVVAQVVRAKGEVRRGVVQNPGRPLGLGQIPGGLRAAFVVA